MSEIRSAAHTLPLRIPAKLYERLEREKARRLEEGGAARPEATAIILEALQSFLTSSEKKSGGTK